MYSKTTDETSSLWQNFNEGEYDRDMIDTLQDLEENAPTEESEGSIRPGGGGGDEESRPHYFWDAKILRMLVHAALEDDAETWDTLEELLVCNHGEMRPLAIGLARLTEGLLISRFEELEREGAQQQTLKNGAEELMDFITPFSGDTSDADPRDRLLAGFAQFLGLGKWDELKNLKNDLDEEGGASEHPEVEKNLEQLLDLETHCTLEKIQRVRESDITFPYYLFLEIVEKQVREAY